MADPLSVQPRDTFSISQTEPDANRPIFFATEPDDTKPEIRLPQPEPVSTPKTGAAPPGMTFVDDLPLDQQSQIYSQIRATPAQAEEALPAGMQDVVEAYKNKPKALFDLSVHTKGGFNMEQWAIEHPDRMKDPQIASTIADAMAMEKERGFNPKDIQWGKAAMSLLHLPLDVLQWGVRAQDLITSQVIRAVGSVAGKEMTPAETAKFNQNQALRSAELVTGTNVGLEGLAGMIHKAGDKSVRKVAEWTGLRAKPTERTPEEKLADMNDRIDAAKRRELTARGNGILTQTFLGSVMKDLERDGVKLDPEAVNTFAAGDPLTFAAFGKGFQILGSGGKLIGSVTTEGQAIRALQKLQDAQQVAAKAGFEHKAALDYAGAMTGLEQRVATTAAGAKSAPIPGELPLTDSAFKAATPSVATQSALDAAEAAGQRAAQAGKTAAEAEADFARAHAAATGGAPLPGTIGQVARVADAAANIAGWAKNAAARGVERGTDFAAGLGLGAVGAVAKAGQFGAWALRGIAPNALSNPLLRSAPKALGAVGDKALEVSAALLKNAPERLGPWTQLVSDAGKAATVDVSSGIVHGGLMDATLAAITNETPAENANSGIMMSAVGGLHGVGFGFGRLVKGQTATPHNYSSDRPVRDLGNFSDLDAATELSLKTSEKSPGVTRRLAALRDMFASAGVEMHLVTDPKQFEDILRKYVPGMTEENIAKARNAGGVNLPGVIVPGTGKRGVDGNIIPGTETRRNLSVFNELSAAEHEGIHGWQDVFSAAGRQKLRQLARTDYAKEWEQIGNGYISRFASPEEMSGYAARGEGWREALIDFTEGSTEWRNEGWTPEKIRDTADNYIAGELVSDVGSSILQSNRGSLEKAPGFPGKLARIIGHTMDAMGVEPFAGSDTQQVKNPFKTPFVPKGGVLTTQGIAPLKFGARERMRLALRDEVATLGDEKLRAKFDAAREGKPVSEKTPVSSGDASVSDAEIVDAAPDTATIRGGRTQREIAADLVTAKNAGAGVSIDYMSAPGEPAGAVSSSRTTRRDIIEAFRSMPADARALWEKTFFPEKLSRTQGGEIQVQGWTPEVFAANAHKLAKALSDANAGDLTPYPIDPKTGSFTSDGWKLLFDDTVQYSKNQMAGLTGAGEPLVVPDSMKAQGFTEPTKLGEPGRKINQDRADVISMLMGIPLPKTGRVGKVYPRNLAGQAVSAATKPGRVSPLVEPRTFTGKGAEKFGVEGEQVREVNPLRAELDLRGIKPDMIEAIQRLNLSNIADVKPNANLPVVRGREFTVQAGFAPKAATEWTKLSPKEVLDEVKLGGKPLTPTAWEVGKSASPDDVASLKKSADEHSKQSRELLKAGKIDEAMQAAMSKQFFSEAVQMAEGKVLPDTKPSFAPANDAGSKSAADHEEFFKAKPPQSGIRFQTGKLSEKLDNRDPQSYVQPGWLTPGGDRFSVPHGGFYHDDSVHGFKEFSALSGTTGPSEQFQAETGSARVATFNSPRSLRDTGNGNLGVSFSRALSDSQIKQLQKYLEARSSDDTPSFVNVSIDVIGPDGKVVAYHVGDNSNGIGRRKIMQFLRDPLSLKDRTVGLSELSTTDPALLTRQLESINSVESFEKQLAAHGGPKEFIKKLVEANDAGFLHLAQRELESVHVEQESEGYSPDKSPLVEFKYKFFDALEDSFYGRKNASFAPKTDAGKSLEEKGFEVEHVGYPGFRSVSIRKDGKTVGEILSSSNTEDAERAHIAGVDVASGFRKQGIADALYRELFTALQSDGVTRVDGYVVHPAPIKTREKLLGEGMTSYYSSGESIPVEQAIAAVSGKEILGPRAVSALAPDIKFAPKLPRFNRDEPTLGELLDKESKPPKGTKPIPSESTLGTGAESNSEFVDMIADGEIPIPLFVGTADVYGETAAKNREIMRERLKSAAEILDAPRDEQLKMMRSYPYSDMKYAGGGIEKIVNLLIDSKNEARWKTGFFKDPSGISEYVKGAVELATGPIQELWNDIIAPAIESTAAFERYAKAKEEGATPPAPIITAKSLKEVDWDEILRKIKKDRPEVFERHPNHEVRTALELITDHPEIPINSLPRGTQDIITELHKAGRKQLEKRGINPVQFSPRKPDENARKVAEDFNKAAGLPYNPPQVKSLDEATSRKLADWYDEAKHSPDSPEVQASYKALAAETEAQWKAIADAGYTLEPWTGKGEPYKSSADMQADVADNKHLYFLKTEGNFSGNENNPMLKPSGVEGLSVNDQFRAVHDFMGHAATGTEFGPVGELNAWRAHSESYSDAAQPALAAETLAQNSWVNYGKHLRDAEGAIPRKGEPGFKPATERPFAEQKSVVVPAELIDRARAQFAPKVNLLPTDKATNPEDAGFGNFWMSPRGDMYRVGDHRDWAKQRINDPDYKGAEVETGLKHAGWVRISREREPSGRPTVFLDGHGRLNERQQSSVEVWSAANPDVEIVDAHRLSSRPLGSNAQFAPKKKKSDDLKFEPTSFGTASKSWILPNGTPVQLGAQWHHDWLSEHPEIQARYGFKVKPFEGNDTEGDRSQALKAGFGRVNFEPNSGTMTVEVRQKDWRKLRPTVEDMADANIDNIDKFKLHLLNEKATKSVDSRFASLFDADSNKEKIQRLTDALEAKASFAPSTKGETEGLPGLDVPREYVTPAERSNMTRQEVRDRFPEAVVPRANGETIPSDVVKSPLYKQAKSEGEAVKLFADRLIEFAKQYKDRPEYDLGARWYSEFTPMLKKEFGKDAGLMAELLAATSPQTGVETNFGYAFDALQSFRAGRFDKIIPKFDEGMAKMEDGSWETWLKRNNASGPATPANFMAHWIEKHKLKPTQSNGKLFGQHSLAVLKVFARRWMDTNAGPKTRNFVGNLLGKSDEATIDLWADRTMRWAGYEGLQDRWRILPENLHSVSDADYAFSEKAFRAAAEQLDMKPSALQGALWFAEKSRWSDNGWGRLDLGNFQTEMEKIPLLKKGFEQRVNATKARSKTKPTEQLGFDISERFK